jgi:hypothetical protein
MNPPCTPVLEPHASSNPSYVQSGKGNKCQQRHLSATSNSKGCPKLILWFYNKHPSIHPPDQHRYFLTFMYHITDMTYSARTHHDSSSSSSLSCDRSIASSKLGSLKRAILIFLLQLSVSSCFLKVIQQLLTSPSSPSCSYDVHWYVLEGIFYAICAQSCWPSFILLSYYLDWDMNYTKVTRSLPQSHRVIQGWCLVTGQGRFRPHHFHLSFRGLPIISRYTGYATNRVA